MVGGVGGKVSLLLESLSRRAREILITGFTVSS